MESSPVTDHLADFKMKTLADIAADTFKGNPTTPKVTEDRGTTEGQPSTLHTPLQEGEFRLLAISPSDDLNAPLVCTLRAVTLSQARYTAISYVWGDPSNPEEARINGLSVPL
ncbi:hypothetical protein P171DRAFT_506311 [Karstenula rhodostoma CBS 690.94]|uniref:Heterokaryon incompatibility domain-containing protein n=1 Tax=Karstenula rhodostoma CBS 690.94 TaxID=1392251 RepID=A0A9P4P4V4_9PLEO|nr:hypothetical protein P171DRAFT_506311 [Karstenula rhodostoma CBS 690.94]